MQSKSLNQNLNAAKTARQDEFYTQLSDIAKELRWALERDVAECPRRPNASCVCCSGRKPCVTAWRLLAEIEKGAGEAEARVAEQT